MSKKRIEKYIPKAIEEINILERLTKENSQELRFPKGIPSSYNGYISSFGASVIQSGLLPTLALFENTNSKTAQDKKLLTDMILNILKEEEENNSDETSLLKYVLDSDGKILKSKIMDIAIAIKLSIRTFKLDKGSKDE